MKVIVCGDRHWGFFQRIEDTLETLKKYNSLIVIQGGATGADQQAREWCDKNSIDCINVPAKWIMNGKAAGPIRNRRMVDEYGPIDQVLAFHNNIKESKGTRDMIMYALHKGIPTALITETDIKWLDRDEEL